MHPPLAYLRVRPGRRVAMRSGGHVTCLLLSCGASGDLGPTVVVAKSAAGGGFGSRVPCWADAGPRALVPLVPCHSTLPWIRDALPPALGHGPPFMRGPCPTLTSSRSALRLRVGSMLGGLGLLSLGPRHHGHGLWEQLALQLRSPAIDALGPGIRASVVTRIWAGHPRGARGGLAREAPRPQAQDGAGSGF